MGESQFFPRALWISGAIVALAVPGLLGAKRSGRGLQIAVGVIILGLALAFAIWCVLTADPALMG
jgi:hypothetical protein